MSPKDESKNAAANASANPSAGPQEAFDFEVSMDRLEAIVRELEGGKVSLERAMALFEEGRKLGQACRAALDSAQVRVDKLLERADGSVETQPFEPPR